MQYSSCRCSPDQVRCLCSFVGLFCVPFKDFLVICYACFGLDTLTPSNSIFLHIHSEVGIGSCSLTHVGQWTQKENIFYEHQVNIFRALPCEGYYSPTQIKVHVPGRQATIAHY